MKVKAYITLFFTLSLIIGRAQDVDVITYPVIGEPLPDFVLDDVHYSEQDQISLSSLKGEPFILDFFSLGCPGCFKSFPQVNDLKKRFESEVEFVLVGYDNKDKGKLLRKAYEAHRKRQNLQLTVTYDSVIFDQFKVSFVPTLIWVDKEGIVQAITNSEDLIEENVRAFINGESFIKSFDLSHDKRQQHITIFDIMRNPLELPEDKVIQKSEISVLGKSKPGTRFISLNFIHQYLDHDLPLKISGSPLTNLYRAAYFGPLSNWLTKHKEYYGKYHYSPILELTDSTLFQPDSMGKERRYSYSQFIPEKQRTLGKVMKTMQQDLYSAFGYKAVVETREMPYLKLVATDEAREKLRTKGGKKKLEDYFGGVNYQNVRIDDLVQIISYLGGLVQKDLPLIDETGITGNIDIELDNVAMLDWKDVKKALQKHGLDMVMGKKRMKVLVINDDPHPAFHISSPKIKN